MNKNIKVVFSDLKKSYRKTILKTINFTYSIIEWYFFALTTI